MRGYAGKCCCDDCDVEGSQEDGHLYCVSAPSPAYNFDPETRIPTQSASIMTAIFPFDLCTRPPPSFPPVGGGPFPPCSELFAAASTLTGSFVSSPVASVRGRFGGASYVASEVSVAPGPAAAFSAMSFADATGVLLPSEWDMMMWARCAWARERRGRVVEVVVGNNVLESVCLMCSELG